MYETFTILGWILFGAAELMLLVTAFRGRKHMIEWDRAERQADIDFFSRTKKA